MPADADTILVVDAGTSALRCVAVDVDGSVGTMAVEPWRGFLPDDAAAFGRELRGDDVGAALSSAIERASLGSGRPRGIAFTGQREGLVFVDERNEALLVSPNVDARASMEGMTIDSRYASEVYRTTGHLPSLMQAPAKLEWLRTNRPDVASRVRKAVPLADWLASRLTGACVASRSLLIENGMLDVTSGEHPVKLWAAIDASTTLIPRVIDDGGVVGEVAHGVQAGLPVVLGGGDTQCAMLGAGATKCGDAGVAAGWSAPVQIVVEAPVLDPDMRTWAGRHVVPERWVVESNAGETGRAWEWLASLLALRPSEADAAAAASPMGARDVMAVLGAARMRASAMTAGVGGLTFPLPIVMSAAERGDVLRSALEATAFAIRANLEQAEEVTGTRAPELRLGGGMSRSAIFARMLADVVGRPIVVASAPETSAVGAAALAAAAVGVHDSLDASVAAMVRAARVVEPAPRIAAQYDDLYRRWLAMCESFESME